MIPLVPAIIALVLLAAVLKISFIYYVIYVFAGVLVATALWTRQVSRDVTFRRDYPTRALLGDQIDVILDVENRGWLPVPWLQFHERLPIALTSPPFFRSVISLLPREKRRFMIPLNCRQRGYYHIGPLTITTGDVLGLRTYSNEHASGPALTVYPKILSLDELGFPSRSPFGHLKTIHPLYEDPSRVVGVRDYQSGDSLRNVNWKTSASIGRLQVKKYEPAMTIQTVLLLNLSFSEYDRQYAYATTEMAIVVAASIAKHLADLRQEVGLLATGFDPSTEESPRSIGYLPRKGRDHLTLLLELLGRVTTVVDEPFCQMLNHESQRLPWGATLVIITARETDELLDTVIALRRRGFVVVLVYVDYASQGVFESALVRATSVGVQCYRIWREEDADVWRRQMASAR